MIQTRRAFLSASAVLCLAGCAGQPAGDQAAIDRIAAYLNGLQRFQARFTQTGAFGEAAGTVWLDRPGHLRIAYDGPQAKTLVASNGRVMVYDAASGGTTTMPVARTPLGMLLTPQITLSGDVAVTGYRVERGVAAVTVIRSAAQGDGSLTLYVALQPLTLVGVLVVDAYQRPLFIHLAPLDLNPALTPDLFRDPSPPVSG
jgi:outer membrane lipoprotein-sorting protein